MGAHGHIAGDDLVTVQNYGNKCYYYGKTGNSGSAGPETWSTRQPCQNWKCTNPPDMNDNHVRYHFDEDWCKSVEYAGSGQTELFGPPFNPKYSCGYPEGGSKYAGFNCYCCECTDPIRFLRGGMFSLQLSQMESSALGTTTDVVPREQGGTI